jgi:hypothetical protein
MSARFYTPRRLNFTPAAEKFDIIGGKVSIGTENRATIGVEKWLQYSHPRCQAITQRNETSGDKEANNVIYWL